MAYGIHPAKTNPDNWRWRLVLWLTGGEIEAIPLLPLRPINRHETVVVKLGYEQGFNTVEVKSMVHMTDELLPIDNYRSQLAPNTFVAIDYKSSDHGVKGFSRAVGTFLGWQKNGDEEGLVLENPNNLDCTWIALSSVKAAWWAPMGYRP